MRINISIFFIFIFVSITCNASIYVKGNLHFDSYYSFGTINSEFDEVNQWWFDKGKVSFITPEWRLTLDKQKQRILAVNRREKKYTEISLPVKKSSHLDQSLIDLIKDYHLDGTLTAMKEKVTLHGKECDGYKVSEWFIFQKERFYDRDRIIRITDDVPFDWRLLEELHQWIYSYFNPQKNYLSQLKKLKGFVLESQNVQINGGKKINWSFKIMEISTKPAPDKIFMIPEGYKKKEKLSREDLIGIRSTVFLYL